MQNALQYFGPLTRDGSNIGSLVRVKPLMSDSPEMWLRWYTDFPPKNGNEVAHYIMCLRRAERSK